MAAAELDDQCPSVSLDSSCDSSSFDGDDCATTAQKVTDLVLPHILGVNPLPAVISLAMLRSTSELGPRWH